MKIKELLSGFEKWTKAAFARDAAGRPVPELSPEATCWCLYGAMVRCYGEDDDHVREKLSEATQHDGIICFNDRSTFEQVKELVERLDI